MTYIAEIKDIPYDKKRADVVLSDGEICRAFKATIKEYGLVEGKNIDFAELKRIAKEGEEHIAFTTAIDSLSRGIKSQNEVRKNLKTKKFSDDAVNVTVEKLLSYNYLGDRAYAEAYVSYKGQKTGRRKIIYELITIKGIDKKRRAGSRIRETFGRGRNRKSNLNGAKVYRKGKEKTHAT